MAWIALFFAGLLEIVWAFSMKASDGFTRLVPSLVTLVAMIASFALLALAIGAGIATVAASRTTAAS